MANVRVDVPITSDPPGADVAVHGYLSNRDWIPIGTTPIKSATVPFGSLQWRVTKSGYAPLEASGSGPEMGPFHLMPVGSAPPGMIFVPRGAIELDVAQADLPDYWIDIYEVTNRQFKQFVDAGGYRTREYWHEPFVKDGRTIDWDAAIAEFHDATGRPGPSTWDVGAYPDGQDEFPVSGVSWYEAAAYAVFAHQQLPTVYHWYRASGAFSVFSDLISVEQLLRARHGARRSVHGLGPYGTFDMAGNVKEWCWNSTNAGRRYVLGGAFADADYQFRDQDAQSPFERRAGFGLRTIEQTEPLAPALTRSGGERRARSGHDQARRERRVSDVPPAVRLRPEDRSTMKAEASERRPAWRREKVSVAAAYGSERVPVYRVRPDIERAAVPGGGDVSGIQRHDDRSSASCIMQWADFFIRSGRVLVYPMYQSTYERHIAGKKGPNDPPRHYDAARQGHPPHGGLPRDT